MDVPLIPTLLGVVPLVALALFVFKTPLSLGSASWIVAGATTALALSVYGLSFVGWLVASAKGLWTGIWVLLIMIPALLLFEVAERSGSLERLGDALGDVAPTPGRRLLLTGWVFPSFLQGVAGFGVPVVVAAPMLVRAGLTPVGAVAACLVGYHWSVTFGSMGSSFFVAASVSQLDEAQTLEFALKAAALLAISGAVGAAILLRRLGGFRDAVIPGAIVAIAMGATLMLVVSVQPALGSTTAGLVGLIVGWLVFPVDGKRPPLPVLLNAAAPYLILTAMVVVAFGFPPVRELLARVPELAPSFPSTAAGFGHVNPEVPHHQPFRPLLHPATYLFLSAGLGALMFRRQGWWPEGGGMVGVVLRSWVKRSQKVAVSLLGLMVLSTILVDSGIIALLARAATGGLGHVYLAAASLVGALGTVLTGSTTASNALFAPLQVSAAAELNVSETTLLAAQTVGGNIGNALTPVNALVAAAAVGATGSEGEILSRAFKDAWPLFVLLIGGTFVLQLLAG